MYYYDLCFIVKPEAAEMVSALLSELLPSGVYIEDNLREADKLSSLGEYDYIDETVLQQKDYAYIHLYPQGEKQLILLREHACRLMKDAGLSFEVSLSTVPDEDWTISWQQAFEVVEAGSYCVYPAWMNVPETDKIPIAIDTVEAYGTGQSPNTRICLEALSTLDVADGKVLDMGTGTGILAIAALLSGAEEALGIDTDYGSVTNSAENAKLNGVGARFRCILRTKDMENMPREKWDYLFAHITADVILKDLPLYSTLLRTGGIFLGGGIVSDRLPEVISALKNNGFSLQRQWEMEEWVTVTAIRK